MGYAFASALEREFDEEAVKSYTRKWKSTVRPVVSLYKIKPESLAVVPTRKEHSPLSG